jgi:hypothetical protein
MLVINHFFHLGQSYANARGDIKVGRDHEEDQQKKDNVDEGGDAQAWLFFLDAPKAHVQPLSSISSFKLLLFSRVTGLFLRSKAPGLVFSEEKHGGLPPVTSEKPHDPRIVDAACKQWHALRSEAHGKTDKCFKSFTLCLAP